MGWEWHTFLCEPALGDGGDDCGVAWRGWRVCFWYLRLSVILMAVLAKVLLVASNRNQFVVA